MRLLLLNQFAPPDTAPTARLLGDLAAAFTAAGWDAVLIGKKEGYRHGKKAGFHRILRDALAHLRLFWSGLLAGPCDWVLCLSDPPGLPFTAALLARIKRARLAHWAMDVYPEVAVRLGALPDGFASRLAGSAMTWGYHECDLLVALDEDMQGVIEQRGGRGVRTLPPWPPRFESSPRASSKAIPRRTWLYSGNLGRAHEFLDLLEAQKVLETRDAPWRLAFQGGGPGHEEAKACAVAMGLKHCDWQPYADDETLLDSLLQADVLIATQKNAMLGLLWPSKLAVMRLTGRPLLWVGPARGKIGEELRAASPMNGVFSPGDAAAIARWIAGLPAADEHPPTTADVVIQKAEQLREQGFAFFTQWLLEMKDR